MLKIMMKGKCERRVSVVGMGLVKVLYIGMVGKGDAKRKEVR